MRNDKNIQIEALQVVKARALVVTDGMETYFPQFSKREKLQISNLHIKPKTYAYNNSVVAFVDEDGTLYVTPDIKGTQKALIENGFQKNYFYVPFSNWDYPVEQKDHWEFLWKMKNANK